MRTLRAALLRLKGLAIRRNDFDQELESHLQLHIDDNLRAGMTQEEAARQARLTLGGIAQTREAYRDRGTVPFLDHLLRDTRFAARQLRRNPAFAATSVLVLAAGIAAGVAIFAFVDAALVKPLPYPNAQRLMSVMERSANFPHSNLSYQDFLDWQRQNTVFESLEAYSGGGFLLLTQNGAEPVVAARATNGFFRTLGVTPELGREFAKGDEHSVIITDGAWRRRFGARKDILGQPVSLSGTPYTVVGVLPASFQFAPRGRAEFWTTLDPTSNCLKRRSCHNLDGLGRLKEGVTEEQAFANLTAIAKQLETQYPDSNRGQSASIKSLAEFIQGNLRPILLVLLGGAGLLLTIACVNVASLLLERAENRRREIAVRSALGASTWRTASQFITEGVLIVLAANAIGLLAAQWAIQLMLKLIPEDLLGQMPYLQGLALNSRVLAFAAVIATIAVLLFSITPLLYLGADKRYGLAEGTRGSSGSGWRRLGAKLVVVELVAAVVLLVGAGLLGRSLYHLLNVELGFTPTHLATLDLAASNATYNTDEKQNTLARKLLAQAQAIPGIKDAALISILPVSFNGNTTWIRIAGEPYNGEHNETNQRDVSPTYFATIGAKLASGRYFTEQDDLTKPRVMIINQTLARKYFPGTNPVGRVIGDTALSPKSLNRIVGVVEDIRDGALDSEIWPAVYYPFAQDAGTYFSLVARTGPHPGTLLPALSAAIRQVDRDLGIRAELTMQDRINNSTTASLHRSSAWLVGGFAALALLLSAVGLYGVIAYSVSQRAREIGIRMALGAERASVCWMVLREAGWLTALGIALGVIVSMLGADLVRNLLFGVTGRDWPTLIAVALVLSLAALLASYLPARRAASVNPADALRSE